MSETTNEIMIKQAQNENKLLFVNRRAILTHFRG